MGRPKKELNWDLVEKKMEAGCSAREIASGVCDINTFYNSFKERYGKSFADFSDDYYSAGDGNLRFAQYMKAISGNIQMLIMLGKERLGQGKEQEKQSPFQNVLDLEHENMILRAENAKMKESLNADKS